MADVVAIRPTSTATQLWQSSARMTSPVPGDEMPPRWEMVNFVAGRYKECRWKFQPVE